ncbi:MAG: hypothetical protein WDZ51_14145 [Pirellulaceae bacterium]
MAPKSILPPSWKVPEIFHLRLGDGPGKQRVMESEGHLLVVAHLPPKPGQGPRGGRFFWREPDGTWHSNDLGGGPAALTKHLEQYGDALTRLERQEEAAVTSEDYFLVISQLHPLLRSTRNLHQVLQKVREVIGNDRQLINLRDRVYELERTAELLNSEAHSELDFLIARRAEQQAASGHKMAVSAHRLNILAATFFPIATLASVFGMQLSHGWETRYAPWPFVLMLLVGLLLGLVLNAVINVPIQPKKPLRREADQMPPHEPMR